MSPYRVLRRWHAHSFKLSRWLDCSYFKFLASCSSVLPALQMKRIQSDAKISRLSSQISWWVESTADDTTAAAVLVLAR